MGGFQLRRGYFFRRGMSCSLQYHVLLYTTPMVQNDRFFPMWNTQLFFTITEIATALGLLVLCDRDVPVLPTIVWSVVTLVGAHVLRSPMDQFSQGKCEFAYRF